MANPKNILIGVSGGIAAYKVCELIRSLREVGHVVRVVMTVQAQHFISRLTMQALSGNPVHTNLMDLGAEGAMGHIQLARWADLVLIAPATADLIAKIAHGLAGDLLTTLCLATQAPLLIAPAMNQQMFQNLATQQNIKLLQERGIQLLGPGAGSQACGEVGPGRMVEPAALFEAVQARLRDDTALTGLLSGLSVLITAGPTCEALDPVRYLSNHSSGKMGFAMAAAAQAAGARVSLVAGPVGLSAPLGVQVLSVESAQEMYQAVMAQVADCDIFIAAAAVADYRPKQVATQKIKKGSSSLILELVQTPDILGEVAALALRPFCVGFAAETHCGPQYAKAKLVQKRLDMIALNEIGVPNVGFHSDTNALTVFWETGQEVLPLASKSSLAAQFVQLISREFYAKNKTQNSELTHR